MKLIVNKDKCPHNHVCPAVKVCPQGAISQKDSHSAPEVDASLCILCGKCKTRCPKGAFEEVE